MLTTIDKALTGVIVPALIAGVMGLLSGVGITGEMSVKTAVTSFITGIAVYLVPNKKA